MTKSLLTIALAAATLPLSFAAPQAATTPAPGSTNQATTQKPKKHVKKSHKTAKKDAAATNAAPAKPASK